MKPNENSYMRPVRRAVASRLIALCLGLGWVAAGPRAGAVETFPVLQMGGDTYSNVTITSVSATDIFFTYDRGMSNAKLKNLTPDLQTHFRYNPAKALEAEKKQAAGNAHYHFNLVAPPGTPWPGTNLPATNLPPPTVAAGGPGGPVPAVAPDKTLWARSFLNQKAPELVVEKWLTDEPKRRGKFVLLDFWATWCGPCCAAITELNGYQQKFGDQLVVIGISDETEDAVRRLGAPKIEYSLAIDTLARTKKVLGVTGIPHVLLIDPAGYVRWEGFPFLAGHELNRGVVAGILQRYGH